MPEIVGCVPVNASVAATWAGLVDWDSHRRWMLLTSVERAEPSDYTGDRFSAAPMSDGAGLAIVGVTGLGPVRFRDSMVVTQWTPPPAEPARCVVRHTGRVVRGAGAFEVESAGGGARVTWSEWVEPPFGVLGALAFVAVRPVAAALLRVSLRRFARLVESDR